MVLTGGKVTRPFGGECAVVGLSPTAASVPGIDCEAIAAAAFVRKPLLGTSRPPQGRSEERRTGPRPRASHCDDCSEARRTGCGREAAGELLPPA